MTIEYRYIRFWLCSIMVLLFLSCSGSDDHDSQDASKPSQLEIRVYIPGRPVVTRAEHVNAEEAEKVMRSLDIWVFEHESGTLVGHLSPMVSESFEGGTFQMTINDDFAKKDPRPKVDVFVMANVSSNNTGVHLPSPVTRGDLQAAMIKYVDETHDYFGLTNPIVAPPNEGLPMSGVLIDKGVDGSLPVLRVPNPVKVVRAISKVRFIFSRTKQQTEFGESQDLKIVGITINNGMIPKAEYLFLKNDYSEDGSLPNCNPVKSNPEVESDYVSGSGSGIALSPLSAAASQIPEYENPTAYAYTGAKTGQDYEDLINTGIESGHLAEIGKFYIRESDKPISGKIHYTIGDDPTPKSSPFHMAREGEFSRNHTWIVFGYFSAKELLVISSVNVLPWQDEYTDYPVYNW